MPPRTTHIGLRKLNILNDWTLNCVSHFVILCFFLYYFTIVRIEWCFFHTLSLWSLLPNGYYSYIDSLHCELNSTRLFNEANGVFILFSFLANGILSKCFSFFWYFFSPSTIHCAVCLDFCLWLAAFRVKHFQLAFHV